MWLQVPLTNGADIGLSLLKRLIGRYVKVRKVVTNVQNSNFILRMLVGFRIITDEQRLVFTEVMSDGSNVILLSMIFLVTPGFVTEVGCLLVGTGYPIYATGKCECDRVGLLVGLLGWFVGWVVGWFVVALLACISRFYLGGHVLLGAKGCGCSVCSSFVLF